MPIAFQCPGKEYININSDLTYILSCINKGIGYKFNKSSSKNMYK